MNDKADLLIGALCWLMTFGLIAAIIAPTRFTEPR
jgi:hypothetical protein